MGAKLCMGQERIVCQEPIADIEVHASELSGIEVSGNMIPRMIDELPILAVAATQAQGRTVIRDAAELRAKETDRIHAMALELAKMGAHIEEKEDGWVIEGPTPLQGTGCRSHDDHRIAMSMAVAGLIAFGETRIQGAECIDISFPGFLETMKKIAHR
jgi:3-phosphoshikimate 1-carboxyvinyltransferase